MEDTFLLRWIGQVLRGKGMVVGDIEWKDIDTCKKCTFFNEVLSVYNYMTGLKCIMIQW